MKKLFYLLSFVGAVALYSCEELDSPNSSDNEVGQSFVYRERDPNYPLILSRPRERHTISTRATELNFDNILGRSFKLDYYPFESMQNVGEPIIKLAKLEADYPAWVTKVSLRQSTSTSFSYSTFDRYEKKSSTTTKVNSGFALNLGIFKIGNKNTYYKHFSSSLTTSSNSVFGQLDIEIKDMKYNLSVNTNRLEQIKKDYIEKDFIDDLYNLHPQELFSFYGPFVLTNFITGGRASALFAGVTKTTTTEETREKTLDSEISTSFALKKTEGSSASLGFGKGYTNSSSSTKTFTQLESTLMTLGGSYGLGAFATPKSIDDMNIDLSAWANSLNNTDNHTLVNIQDNGLVPLSAFFIEENLKVQYERYVAGEDLPSKRMTEPKLLLEYKPRAQQLWIAEMSLITRFNDAIAIRHDIVPYNDMPARKEIDDRFSELCDKYKIKAEIRSLGVPENYNSRIGISDYIKIGDYLREGVFLEPKMKKYHNVERDILYLLYNENGKKVGYSIHMGKGDYLLDTYGIRHWVDALPTTTVSDNELLGYTLIVL